jgi:hypothetical protein
VSLIIPRSTFLRVLDALRWSRLAWSSLALGAAFAAGALTVGILARPSADVQAAQKPIAMAPVATSPADVVPIRSRKTTRTKPGRKLPDEAVAKRETIGFAGVEAAAPSVAAASHQVAPAVPGDAQAQDQDQTSASISGEAPRVASDAEQSANGPSSQEAEAAKKAMNEARRAKRLAKRSRWRMAQAQLDANGSQWAYTWPNERQLTFHHRNGRRGTALAGYRVAKPSFFSFLRFGNRNM